MTIGFEMEFQIDEKYICDITIRKEWGVFDHITEEELSTEQLIKILMGKDRVSSISSEDHPEFNKLREQLGRDGFIRIQSGSWNGDRVLQPFSLNGVEFKIGEQFMCGAAMKSHLKYKV